MTRLNHYALIGVTLACLTSAAICVSPVGSCHGDCNGDRRVDGRDLNIVLHNYGSDDGWITRGDVNDDGKVNGGDLIVVVSTYGCKEF